MHHFTKFGLPVLLLTLAILLSSCGSAPGGSKQGAGTEDASTGQTEKTSRSPETTAATSDMGGMDHGSGGMATGMVMKNGRYSDERFIDAMVPHHQGAVEMARVALKNAEHDEIKHLSGNIITTQKAEIKELESIKQEVFGTSQVPMDVSMGEMKSMGMMMNPEDLAKKDPFDKAFIDSMIPHHQSAIEMAQVALHESKNQRIKDLATNIVEAQRREISQMTRWRAQWYPQG